MTHAADWIGALRDPRCYPHAPPAVEVVQTHISVVCLAGELVFKLKKAVVLPFLDAGSAGRRLYLCREEVRLNRRLCPDVYLGVVPLHRQPDGLRFGPPLPDTAHPSLRGIGTAAPSGPVIDHAVLMRRLPQERMLDQLLQRRAVSRGEIEALARTVATFHAGAARGPEVQELGSPARLQQLALDNFAELRQLPEHGLPAALLDALEESTRNSFIALLPALQARAAQGRVVDGHGDLHARNVCLTRPPAIYDCIEFAPGLRCGDVATEIAFLVMDLRYRQAPGLARVFATAYAAASGDAEAPALLPALVAYRAMVRTKVAALTAGDAALAEADRAGARASARNHLLLAAIAAAEAGGRRWLLLCGPPASGKSTLASALAAAAGWPHFATDVVRKELAGLAPAARARSEHYTAAYSDRTYAELLARARRATAGGEGVVLLDGNFPTAARRAEAAAAARSAGAQLLVLYVQVDAATARQRARARDADPANASDADAAIAERLRATFVPPQAEEGIGVLALDGRQPIGALQEQALAGLLAGRPR